MSETAISAAMQAQNYPIVDKPLELGGVSFHSGWFFHRAGANVSAAPRLVKTIIDMNAGMRPAEPSTIKSKRTGRNGVPAPRSVR